MHQPGLLSFVILMGMPLIASCSPSQISPTPEANLPNPASVFCEEQGGKLELRQDASGGVAGVCVFPDGSECDEWAYYRGECAPAPTTTEVPTDPTMTAVPSPLPIDPADYQGWWTYTHPVYSFSIMLPEDWDVAQTTSNDPQMNDHTLMLHPGSPAAIDLNIRMAFRRVGEDIPLWPTGVGSGEFIPQGTLDVAGTPVRRVLFACPTGQINAIWYHGAAEADPNIRLGEMEFGYIFSYTGVHCQEGYSLGGKTQRLGEMIIASLRVP